MWLDKLSLAIPKKSEGQPLDQYPAALPEDAWKMMARFPGFWESMKLRNETQKIGTKWEPTTPFSLGQKHEIVDAFSAKTVFFHHLDCQRKITRMPNHTTLSYAHTYSSPNIDSTPFVTPKTIAEHPQPQFQTRKSGYIGYTQPLHSSPNLFIAVMAMRSDDRMIRPQKAAPWTCCPTPPCWRLAVRVAPWHLALSKPGLLPSGA